MSKIGIEDVSFLQNNGDFLIYEIKPALTIFGKQQKENFVGLSVHKRIDFKQYIDDLNDYIVWISDCKNDLEAFYKNEFSADIEECNFDLSTWYDTLEIFSSNITLTEKGIFGTEISCGDTVFEDHILDIDILGKEIESMHLDG
jgi:hypothetical protein